MIDSEVFVALGTAAVVAVVVLLTWWMGSSSVSKATLLKTQDVETVVPWVDSSANAFRVVADEPLSLEPTVKNGNRSWSDAQLDVLIPMHFGSGPGIDLLSEFVKPRTVAYFLTNREMPWDEHLGFSVVDAMIMLIQSRMIAAPHADDPDEQRWRLTVKGATFLARLTPDPAVCNAARKFL